MREHRPPIFTGRIHQLAERYVTPHHHSAG